MKGLNSGNFFNVDFMHLVIICMVDFISNFNASNLFMCVCQAVGAEGGRGSSIMQHQELGLCPQLA